STEKEVPTSEDAIAGAKDIIAEWISDEASYRQWIRSRTFSTALIVSTVKDKEKDDKQTYEMYYDYSEPVKKIVPHRVLALNRGEKEGVLRISIHPDIEMILAYLVKKVIKEERSIVTD